MDQIYDVMIIGGGSAATSAAMTLRNRGKSIAVVTNRQETVDLYKRTFVDPGFYQIHSGITASYLAVLIILFLLLRKRLLYGAQHHHYSRHHQGEALSR